MKTSGLRTQMQPERYADRDIFPDNWKEWAISLFLVTITVLSVYAVYSTGAYSVLFAQRTVTVTTAGDASGLISFTVENDEYARIQDGRLEIGLAGSFGDESSDVGFNLDSRTEVNRVFNITNEGPETVEVWITTHGRNPTTVIFFEESFASGSASPIDTRARATSLPQDDSVLVSMVIDTRGVDLYPNEKLIDSITVHAEANPST